MRWIIKSDDEPTPPQLRVAVAAAHELRAAVLQLAHARVEHVHLGGSDKPRVE